MRSTIKDIALRAGVSKTTVSFAFNDPSRISETTRDRVMTIAGELGYVPDPIARTLATGRIGAIGLLLPQPIHEALRNPYLGELLQGIGAACLERESALMIVPPIEGRVMEAARRAVVDALLAIGVGPDRELVELMRNRHIPLVTIDGDSEGGIPNVGIDDEAAAFELLSHVLGLGHTRVAIVELECRDGGPAGGRGSMVRRKRLAGFERAMASSGLDPAGPEIETLDAPCSLDGGRSAGMRILDRGIATAVVAMADIVALGVFQACSERGVAIPGSLSVASFDDIELSSIVRPGLTSLRQPGYLKGYVAGRALLSMRDGVSPELALDEASARMPYELIIRASTAAPRGSA